MKKINNKGLGHHMLLVLVAVVAVIGAAGYFVWQRQQDNDIDASASGYSYQSVASLGYGSKWGRPSASYFACVTKIKGNVYQVNMYFRTDSKDGPSKGQIKINGSVVHTFNIAPLSTKLSSKTFSRNSTIEFYGESYVDYYKKVIPLGGITTNITDLISCNKASETSTYKYEVVASNSDKNTQYLACKIKSGNTWMLETKLVSTNVSYVFAENPNNSNNYSYIANGEFGSTAYGKTPTINRESLIKFEGEYTTNLYDTLILQGTTKTIETVTNCI